MKFTQEQKLSAKNALDYQQRLLDLRKETWQEQWETAENPFGALKNWRADKPIRDAAYLPWEEARRHAALCGAPAK